MIVLYRKTYVSVNLDNLKSNVKNLISYYNDYEYYFGVVKGNCYGHGIKYVVDELISCGINYLAVSSLDEAMEVREYNRDIPILSLEPIDLEYLDICILNNITISICSLEYYNKLLGMDISGKLKVHLKVDSGMNRLGFNSPLEFSEVYNNLKKKENIIIEGVFSHFATLGINDKYWDMQLEKFNYVTSLIDLYEIPIRHLYRSATLINHRKLDFCNGVRLGIAMYGYYNPLRYSTNGIRNKLRFLKREYYKKKYKVSFTNLELPIELKSAFSMYSQIIQVKKIKKGDIVGYGALYKASCDEVIGIISVGYADGFRRSNKGNYVYINDKRYQLIGDIGMGMCMVRVDDSVKVGDVVTLIGDNCKIKDIANYNKTTIYEILCGIPKSVSRVYVSCDKVIGIDEEIDYE